MTSSWEMSPELQHFRAARGRALLASILDLVRQQPNDLLTFEDVRRRINVRGQHAIGQRTVELDQIVGSEGRYADFDRHFLPRATVARQRWGSVGRLMLKSGDLPPIDLWKIGDIYFVRDGNHRVSVARTLGRQYIEAEITELIVDVPLTPALSVRDLLRTEEYSDFLEWTNLHQLRPDERIEFSELGCYLDLVRHINVHRALLAQQRGGEISRDEAVADWYDAVYMPIVRLIRERRALGAFQRRTEADLYRWIMERRDAIAAERGAAPDPQEVAGASLGSGDYKGPADVVDELLRRALQVVGLRRPRAAGDP
ncbi:MAG: hypothetical protein IPO81_22750 [Kouleothrix sp.]|nr:hypothetical protein [Kouleothrix sp.]